VDRPSQTRTWAAFVAAIGLVLMGLCALQWSAVALLLGAVLTGVGLLALLLSL
jgi:hypothetical protein